MKFDFVALVVGFRPSDRNTPFYAELGAELKKRGYSFGCLTNNPFADRFVADYGHTFFNQYDMAKALKSRQEINYPEEAQHIEQQYGINIKNYCLAEAMLQKPHAKNDEQLAQEVVEDFLLVEDFLESHQVGCFIWDQGGDIIRRVLYQVGRLKNIPTVWINWSPIRDHMSLHSTELDVWDDFKAVKNYASLTPEEISEAERYITSFRERQEMYLHRTGIGLWRLPLTIGWGIASGLYRKYVVNQGQEPRKVVKLYYLLLQMQFKKLLYDISLSKNVDRDEKFFFFPLHFPRESQLTVKAPHCLDQEAIVAMVARSLPAGYKLYVKEHPNHVGEMSLRAISQIARMKDVVLLHPRTHSHRLIQNSAGVVVINSTVGFEAIIYQKPAVVLGKPFYSGKGLTIDVPDYFYLPEALRQALELKEIPCEQVVAFISAVLKASYKGIYGDSGQQNITAVADSVLTYLKRNVAAGARLS